MEMIGSYTKNTLEYNPEMCTGCEMCIDVCPHGVFAMNSRTAEIQRKEACMECGACQINCPSDAIKVDSGVGCAAAMIFSALTRRKTVTCCSD